MARGFYFELTMDNQVIKFSTKLTVKDLKRIGFRQIRTKLILFGSILFLFLIFSALGIAAILLSKKNDLPLTNIFPILIPIGIFSFILFSLIWAVSKQAQRSGESIEQADYVFNDQGLEIETESSSVKTLWAKLLKVEETKTDFLIFTQKNIAIPIPKHFLNDNQLAAFKELLREKLGKNARLKN